MGTEISSFSNNWVLHGVPRRAGLGVLVQDNWEALPPFCILCSCSHDGEQIHK